MPDISVVKEAALVEMPFGKYTGRTLMKLPISYFEWFSMKGFPKGKLGMQMQTIYEIKLNGLDDILHEITKK